MDTQTPLLETPLLETPLSERPLLETPLLDEDLPEMPIHDEHIELERKIIPLVFNESMDATNKHNVLLINSSVLESQLFYDSANTNTYPIMYSTSSTKEELLQLLNDKFPNGFNRLSVVFHDPGYNFYKTFLNNKGLFDESDLLENATIFSENTVFLVDLLKNKNVQQIDFLACNTLNYPIWKQFYEMLQLQTNVTVGASDDNTGNVKYGADWVMESTLEDIKNIYFNENIENYASTLAASLITSNTGNLFIRQLTPTSDIQGSTDNIYWSTVVNNNYPIYVRNLNTSNTLNVNFTTNITISSTIASTNGYFIPETTNINFNGLKSDNTRCQITIKDINGYPGFFKNGDWSNNGKSNITVQNFDITTNNSKLADASGWLCMGLYGINSLNNLVMNCTNYGHVTGVQSGGITGSYFSYGGSSTILNCKNYGNIYNIYQYGINFYSIYQQGGITGSAAGRNSSTLNITNCLNYGDVLTWEGGGIVGPFAGDNSSTLNITNCSNYGSVESFRGGGVVGPFSTAIIAKCVNTGNISGGYAGGLVGKWFCKNTNKTCTITNSYNIGNISGTNAGGICGAEVAYSNDGNAATIRIINCYSRGTIATNCGGFFGGAEGNTSYSTTPIVSIDNCYSSGAISNGGGGFIAPSLQIHNLIGKRQSYIANNSWTDASANDTGNLSDTPTDVYNQGLVWTKLAGTNIPYVLTCFNSDIYSPKLGISVVKPYSSSIGLYDGSYNINCIKYNNTQYSNENNYITINSTTGLLTFSNNLSDGNYVVSVFASKYKNEIPYSYNYNTFAINDLSCFNHDTKILCLIEQSGEKYIPIQDLRKGHLVKTYLHGYKKIQRIGKGVMINDPTDWKKCMFKMEKNEENELIEDLIITGWHGVLVDKLEQKQEDFQQKLGFRQSIDGKEILLASASSNFKAINNENKYTFYHFALEDDGDENKRFGVYANGLLVEIPSKKMFESNYYDEM